MSRHLKRKSKSKKRQSGIDTIEEFRNRDEDEAIFEIKTSPVMGRYIVSRKPLKPGEIILRESPLVVGPCTGSKPQCLGCYTPLSNTSSKCKNCHWPLCSSNCKGLKTQFGHTDLECKILERGKFEMELNAIVPLRCLLLKETNPEAYQKITQMESHSKIRRSIPELWRSNQISVVDKIRKEWSLEKYSEEEIHNICGILEVNSFEIGQQEVNLRGLYPTAFLMSHDCVPNTNHIDEEDTYNLTVRASTEVARGEMITLSYAYTLQNTLKRREHLLENKFFECSCKRCSDPTELNTHLGSLICPRCKTGFVLSSNPLNPEADWKCNCLGYTLSARSLQLLTEKISQEVEAIDSNNIAAFEFFLQKYRNVLHPTHYLNLSVKLSLSQLYGRITGYLIDELSEKLLLRKKEICEEILRIFDVIEPGLTRLRGVTLYEMHAPMMILLTRQFEKKCSKSVLRCQLRKIVKCLEEASLILSFESKSSPEGIMGVAAQDALVKIREWEKILGRI